jgi:ABC-type cobalamin/Fe3+-siderophores transport system ATPase subunit
VACAMINAQNLSLVYNKTVFSQVSCMLSPGQINCFIGKSGVGKSSLLRILSGLIGPTEGTVYYNSTELSLLSPLQRAQQVGFVLQYGALFRYYTALENCT